MLIGVAARLCGASPLCLATRPPSLDCLRSPDSPAWPAGGGAQLAEGGRLGGRTEWPRGRPDAGQPSVSVYLFAFHFQRSVSARRCWWLLPCFARFRSDCNRLQARLGLLGSEAGRACCPPGSSQKLHRCQSLAHLVSLAASPLSFSVLLSIWLPN